MNLKAFCILVFLCVQSIVYGMLDQNKIIYRVVRNRYNLEVTGSEIYYNGILGPCFIPKKLKAQQREARLEHSRNENYKAMASHLLERKNLLEGLQSKITGERDRFFAQEEIAFIKSEIAFMEEHKCLPCHIKFKPVVLAVFHERNAINCSFFMRKAFHNLRSVIEGVKIEDTEEAFFGSQKNNPLEVFTEYFQKYSNRINVLYSDGLILNLSFDGKIMMAGY